MFTGIIQTLGQVSKIEQKSGDLRLTIRAPELDWPSVSLGDSIATNGVCLTVVALPERAFVADVSLETVNFTTVSSWQSGDKVNLEMALTPNARFGGHIVSGHVDGVGQVISLNSDARSWRFQVRAPDQLAKYIAQKGSITVDGVSLTVNSVNGSDFDLNIVPHTFESTCFDRYKVGTKVNLEVDLIARYLERLLLGDKASEKTHPTLTREFLAGHGYESD